MATKKNVPGDPPVPTHRFIYHSDRNKFGRFLALLLSQFSSADKRGAAQIRFDVYPVLVERVTENGKSQTVSVAVSRIYVQRDIDKDDTLPGRPYLLVEESYGAERRLHLDVSDVTVTKVDHDEKGRPMRDRPREVYFEDLPEVADDAYEFLVGM